MTARIYILLTLALHGCAHQMSPAAAAIRDTTPETGVVANCERLPDVWGSSWWVGDAAAARAMADGREAAALQRADIVIWQAPVSVNQIGYPHTVIAGFAYRCPSR